MRTDSLGVDKVEHDKEFERLESRSEGFEEREKAYRTEMRARDEHINSLRTLREEISSSRAWHAANSSGESGISSRR
jgi:hypothetical protein